MCKYNNLAIPQDAKDILCFWFDTLGTTQKWFESGSSYDEDIRYKFSDIYQEAIEGNLIEWINNPYTYLAYIILLDQFSRHIYRGTPMAYEQDKNILIFTEMGLDYIDQLTAQEIQFALMPYQHSEKLADQKLGIYILERLLGDKTLNLSPKDRNILKTALYHQKEHHNVIEKYGRFPLRNKVLTRESTMEEIDYIDNHGGLTHY